MSLNEGLDNLRLQNTGCDVTIEIGPASFPAHRIVLVVRMEYFRNILNAYMEENSRLIIPLDPLIIDSAVFEDILGYVYTSKIDFTIDNIRSIISAAVSFCFDELTTKAKDHIKETMTTENVFFYRSIAAEFGLELLEGDCKNFIIESFSSDINKDLLIPILAFEDFKKVFEKLKAAGRVEEMFDLSVGWILQDKGQRSGMLVEFLKDIPLQSLSFDFFKNALQIDLIRRNEDCVMLLTDSFYLRGKKLEAELKLTPEKSTPEGPNEEPAKPPMNARHLYAIGGDNDRKLSSVSQYDSTGQWSATTSMSAPRSHFGCAAIGRKIYICGGWNGKQNLNELTVFDTHTQEWTQRKPMKHSRQNGAAAVLNGQLYVAGGYDGTKSLAVVERYFVGSDRWEEVSPMIAKRGAPELVAVNGFLYAIGGFDGDGLKTVERYDPKANQWTAIADMNYRYAWFGSAVLDGLIYVVDRDRAEVYNPTTDKWTVMPAPSRCNGGRQLAVYDGKLLSIGGLDGPKTHRKGLKTVEMFDFEARAWRPEVDMDTGRCHHGVAVA